MSERDIKFLLQGTLQIAPSPSYLKTIGIIASALCPLCTTHCASFRHIESYCKTALDQPRYTWRHDELLRIIHYAAGKFVWKMTTENVKKPPKRVTTLFVLEGEDDKQDEGEGADYLGDGVIGALLSTCQA